MPSGVLMSAPSSSRQVRQPRLRALNLSANCLTSSYDFSLAALSSLMVIGLKYGQTTGDDKAAKEKSYELVRQFAERFKARNRGCLTCRDLLGADISTPEGMQKLKEKQAFTTMCPKFVRDAAEIVEELL